MLCKSVGVSKTLHMHPWKNLGCNMPRIIMCSLSHHVKGSCSTMCSRIVGLRAKSSSANVHNLCGCKVPNHKGLPTSTPSNGFQTLHPSAMWDFKVQVTTCEVTSIMQPSSSSHVCGYHMHGCAKII